ncbi:amidase [Streptomyces rhizosphaericus]|uniref:amidase n=1 Tax=Streptomyces rhizosphaericus TaxID=114699 RepID=UPI0027E50DA3|nr:amidase [Streptomyces rhizosphaericus]
MDLATAVRTREISPVEILDIYLRRIDKHDPEINAFVWRDDETARAAARVAAQRVLDGTDLPPFHGVPIPVKDSTQVAGQPATHGARGVSDAPRTLTEPVVSRFLDAGFLLTGRTNSPEMTLLSATDNNRYGNTRNPWNLKYTPGGSSGGAAAAVAAGLAPVAHGNDGGGSIRMPSSCCGLLGLKPSRGRVPSYVPTWDHAVVEGAITRTTRDAAALLDIMSVPDRLAMYQAPPPERPFADEVGRDAGQLRIGLLLDAPTGVPVAPECVAAAEHTARLLEALGHKVFPAAPRFFSHQAFLGYATTILDAAQWAAPYDDPGLAEPHMRYRMRQAEARHSGLYVQASQLLMAEAREARAQWGREYDVLLTPTMACPPPLVGHCLEENNARPDGPRLVETQMISFTSVCNITGLPAVSIPTYTSDAGLPIGSQLIGGPWDEAVLIRLASALENLDGWARRHPTGFASGTL